MPPTIQDPDARSFTPINMWAMLRAMINANVVILPLSGTPANGAIGTGFAAGQAGPGSMAIDITTGNQYINVGTLASPVWNLTDGISVINTLTLTLTSAQIKAIRATPITLLAAPGAGKINRIISMSAYMNYAGTNAFTNPQNLSAKYKDGTTTALNVITAAGFLDQTASEEQGTVLVAGVIISKANSDNQPVVIHNTGASEITGNAAGDNTIVIKVAYAIDSVTWT